MPEAELRVMLAGGCVMGAVYHRHRLGGSKWNGRGTRTHHVLECPPPVPPHLTRLSAVPGRGTGCARVRARGVVLGGAGRPRRGRADSHEGERSRSGVDRGLGRARGDERRAAGRDAARRQTPAGGGGRRAASETTRRQTTPREAEGGASERCPVSGV